MPIPDLFELSDDSVPLKRPHYVLRERNLFFLISTRAHLQLDDVDETLWKRIDGTTTVGQLRERVPDVGRRIRRLWEARVCELAQPPFTQSIAAPEGRRPRRRVLVVEPHMDDAVLSVGGSLWSQRATCEFTVVTVASHSNFTSYWDLDRSYFDVATVSALRTAESRLAMRLIGGRHRALGELEAPLRFRHGNWTLDWYRHHRKLVDAFIMHCSTEDEIESWALAVERLLRDTDAEEIWLPLGVGGHTDHELTRNACLRALTRLPGLERRTLVFFYEDVPYAVQSPDHTAGIAHALASAGAVLERHQQDIRASFDAKLRLVSIFGSQFKPEYMAARVADAARQASGSGHEYCELRFRVERAPAVVDTRALYVRRSAIERLIPAVTSWYDRHRQAREIRILSPVPVGRWRDDLSFLLSAFPSTMFDVHVSEEYLDETERLVSTRIAVQPVRGRQRAWLARLLRVAASPPRPTILLTGEALWRWSPFARVPLFFCDPLAATRMNDLVLALRGVADRSKTGQPSITEARL